VSSTEHLATLTGWPGQGRTDTDWVQAEEELGVAVPSDFRELASRFPDGTFQGYLYFQPGTPNLVDLRDRLLGELRRCRSEENLEDTAPSRDPDPSYPYPLWPEPEGIFPWAMGSGGEIFFWLRNSPDPGSWPVVWCHGEDREWERFDGITSEFLIALVTGQIDAPRLGSPTFPSPPRFDKWEGLRFIPKAGPGRPLSDEEIERIKDLAMRPGHSTDRGC
jgi:hypothetical protein